MKSQGSPLLRGFFWKQVFAFRIVPGRPNRCRGNVTAADNDQRNVEFRHSAKRAIFNLPIALRAVSDFEVNRASFKPTTATDVNVDYNAKSKQEVSLILTSRMITRVIFP